MTFLVEGTNSHFFGTSAQLISDVEKSTAAWASDKIVNNPALAWVVANYVEAGNPNRNGQLWQLEGLKFGQPTIAHAPMNVDHKSNYIIGTFVGSEMVYPTTSESAANPSNPFIEVLGCIWKAYASQALEDITRAYEQASLFTSMECIAETVTCASEGGCGLTFPYAGPWSESYCSCMQEPDRIQQLNKPHFLAGAMILPPNRPGWAGAEVKQVAELVKKYSDEAEKLYAAVSAEAPNAEPEQLEAQTLAILQQAHPVEPVRRMSPEAIGRIVAAIKA